jgi:hypothetical protein
MDGMEARHTLISRDRASLSRSLYLSGNNEAQGLDGVGCQLEQTGGLALEHIQASLGNHGATLGGRRGAILADREDERRLVHDFIVADVPVALGDVSHAHTRHQPASHVSSCRQIPDERPTFPARYSRLESGSKKGMMTPAAWSISRDFTSVSRLRVSQIFSCLWLCLVKPTVRM